MKNFPQNCQRRKVQKWNATSSKICRRCVHYLPLSISCTGIHNGRNILGTILERGSHVGEGGRSQNLPMEMSKRTNEGGGVSNPKKIPTSFMNGPIQNNTFQAILKWKLKFMEAPKSQLRSPVLEQRRQLDNDSRKKCPFELQQ